MSGTVGTPIARPPQTSRKTRGSPAPRKAPTCGPPLRSRRSPGPVSRSARWRARSARAACSQRRNDSPVSRGVTGASAIMARGDGKLVGKVRACARAKTRARCAGRRQGDGRSSEARPPGSRKVICSIPADAVVHADAPVEIDEIGAAAQQHVLAVVDDLAGPGMLVGRGASAEIGPALKQGDLKPRRAERSRRRARQGRRRRRRQ